MKRSMHRNQFGDTIVEVLFAVVVVGLAIALGYGIASRSLRASRQSQERIEALKIVEGQIEQLKNAANSGGGASFFDSSAVYCIKDGRKIKSTDYSPLTQSLDEDGLALAGYDPQCVNGLYYTGIHFDDTSDTFTIWARWDSIGNTKKEEIKMAYRMYSP